MAAPLGVDFCFAAFFLDFFLVVVPTLIDTRCAGRVPYFKEYNISKSLSITKKALNGQSAG